MIVGAYLKKLYLIVYFLLFRSWSFPEFLKFDPIKPQNAHWCPLLKPQKVHLFTRVNFFTFPLHSCAKWRLCVISLGPYTKSRFQIICAYKYRCRVPKRINRNKPISFSYDTSDISLAGGAIRLCSQGGATSGPAGLWTEASRGEGSTAISCFGELICFANKRQKQHLWIENNNSGPTITTRS